LRLKGMADDKFHVTATSLATFFTLEQCQRYLFLQAHASKHNDSPTEALTEAQFEKGRVWESYLCSSLQSNNRLYAEDKNLTQQQSLEWTKANFTIEKFTELLSDKEEVYIHGSAFSIPIEIYNLYNLDPNLVSLGVIKPDFLRLFRVKDQQWIFIQVIDAKASHLLKISHQVQVSFYTLILNEIIANEPLLKVYFTGGVWMPESNQDGNRIIGDYTTFNTQLFFPILQRTLKSLQTLALKDPKDLSSDLEWYFSPKCKYCAFQPICESDTISKNRVGNIPDLPVDSQAWLETLIHTHTHANSENNLCLGDIEDLHQLIQENQPLSSIGGTITKSQQTSLRKILKIPTARYSSSVVLDSVREHSVKVLSNRTLLMSHTVEDLRVLFQVLSDPLSDMPYCISIETILVNPQISNSQDVYQRITLLDSDYSNLIQQTIETICSLLERITQQNLTVQFYIFSHTEKSILVQSLVNLACDPSLTNEFYQKVQKCLFNFVDDASLLLARHQPTPLDPLSSSTGNITPPRIIVVQQILSEMLSIPTPGFLTLQKSFSFLTGITENLLSEELIYKSFLDPQKEEQTREYAQTMCNYQQQIISKFRELLQCFSQKQLENLMIPSLTQFYEICGMNINDPTLRRIAFVEQYELLCIRQELVEQRKQASQYSTVIELRFNQKSPTDNTLALFDLTQGAELIDSNDSSSMYEWILFKKSDIDSVVFFNDFQQMSVFYRKLKTPAHLKGKLSFVDIREVHLQGETPQIQLQVSHPYFKSTPGTEYVLFKRLVNFNYSKISTLIANLDAPQPDGERPQFLQMVDQPHIWGNQDPFPISSEVCKEKNSEKLYNEAGKLAGTPGTQYSRDVTKLRFTPSQKKAFNLIQNKRLCIIWGPPGTGKTHLLGLAIWRMLEIAHLSDNPFRVLVTANTNAAIDKLMATLEYFRRLTLEVTPNKPWKISLPITRVSIDTKTKIRLEKLHVVGSTCWKLASSLASGSLFDLIVIDEGTQLALSTAGLALQFITKGGRVVVAGDHHQLGRIICGTYPKLSNTEAVVSGSILECILRKTDGTVVRDHELPLLSSADLALTTMLYENNRMNKSLNDFTGFIYGPRYTARKANEYISFNPIDPERYNPEYPLFFKNIIWNLLDRRCSLCAVEVSCDQAYSVSQEMQLNYEADLIVRFVTSFRRVNENENIFVVVPHRVQRSWITQKLGKLAQNNDLIKVDTVDRMQGQEASIVIVSYLFLNEAQISRESKFLYNRRRLNVSISRAQNLCIVVGSKHVFHPPVAALSNSEISPGIQHLQNFKKLCDLNQSCFYFHLKQDASGLYDQYSEVALPDIGKLHL